MGSTNVSSGLAPAQALSTAPVGRTHVRIEGLKLFDFVQIAFDLLALTAAWGVAAQLRFALNPLMTNQLSAENLHAMAPPLGGLLVLWTVTNLWLIASGRGKREPGALNMLRLSESTLMVSTLAVIVTFFHEEMRSPVSRSFIWIFAPVSYCMLIAARWAEHIVWIHVSRSYPALLERVALVGFGPQAWEAADRIRKTESGAVELAGLILPGSSYLDGDQSPAPVLGSTSRLAELINVNRLDRVLVLRGCLTDTELEHCSKVAKRMNVVLSHEIGASVLGTQLRLETRFGMHMVDCRPVSFTQAEELLKRLFDVVTSLVLLVLFAPVILTAALLVKLTSKGPAFYHSTRVGKGGRHFTFYKLRSMYYDAEGRRRVAERNEVNGHLFKIKRDPRITPVGRFIRRFSIDELPQLFNVLVGDMSLLGPRPLPAEDLDPDGMSSEYPHWAELRSVVKPGITGLWQVQGRSDLSFEQMIELDLQYIQTWSLLLDLKILLATPLAVVTGRGAY